MKKNDFYGLKYPEKHSWGALGQKDNLPPHYKRENPWEETCALSLQTQQYGRQRTRSRAQYAHKKRGGLRDFVRSLLREYCRVVPASDEATTTEILYWYR